MKKILILVIILACIACGYVSQATQNDQPPTQPAAIPTITANPLLGSVTSLMFYFEHEHQFDCDTSGNHWRCVAPGGLVKIVFFNDPVTESAISIPLDAANSKPSKYVVALLFQTGLDNSAWDWLVSQMKQAESSRIFENRRVTTQMDNEAWLVTIEAVGK